MAATLAGDPRTVMETLWPLLHRDYVRPVSGDELLRATGLDGPTLALAVRDLMARPRPYVDAQFDPGRPDRLVEVRLTVDGQMYCRARD